MAIPEAALLFILNVLQYERLPGSDEHWVSPEGDPFFFPYYRRGEFASVLEQPVKELILSLPLTSLRRLKAAIEEVEKLK